MSSTVDQQFWSEEPGLVPLLLAMGAASLAFVPLRPAVIVEGGSDLVLLPSLLKEALKQDVLGYQVVPGAANVPPVRVAGIDLQGVQTVWVLDGDKGGQLRRDFLVANAVHADRVLLLTGKGDEPLDLEDLVHPEAYVAAVNAYAQDVGLNSEFTAEALPSSTCARHKAVEVWFNSHGAKPPGKTAVAAKVLELLGDQPLLDPVRRQDLRQLQTQLKKLLGLAG